MSSSEPTPPRPRSRWMPVLFTGVWLVALSAGLAVSVVALYAQRDTDAPPRDEADLVAIDTIVAAPQTRERIFTGFARPSEHASLSFTVGGRVVTRPVEIGDVVDENAVIAVLDQAPFANALAAAEGAVMELTARLELVEHDVTRFNDLVDEDAAFKRQLEEALSSQAALEGALVAAAAQREEAARLKREATLRAPFRGTVVAVEIEPNEVASPGRMVARIVRDAAIEVEVELPEDVLAHIDDDVPIALDFPRFGVIGLEAQINHLARAIDRPGRLYPAIVTAVPAQPTPSPTSSPRPSTPSTDATRTPAIPPGATAIVRMRIPADGRLAVPLAAIADAVGGRPAVFTYDADTQRVRSVAITILDYHSELAVIDGPDLAIGTPIVVAGLADLLDGQHVTVAPARGDRPSIR